MEKKNLGYSTRCLEVFNQLLESIGEGGFKSYLDGGFKSYVEADLNRIYDLIGYVEFKKPEIEDYELDSIDLIFTPFMKNYSITIKVPVKKILEEINYYLEIKPYILEYGAWTLTRPFADEIFNQTREVNRIEPDATDDDLSRYDRLLKTYDIVYDFSHIAGVTKSELKSVVNKLLERKGLDVRV